MNKVRRFREYLSGFFRLSLGIREIGPFVAELARVQTEPRSLPMFVSAVDRQRREYGEVTTEHPTSGGGRLPLNPPLRMQIQVSGPAATGLVTLRSATDATCVAAD